MLNLRNFVGIEGVGYLSLAISKLIDLVSLNIDL